MVNNKGHYQHQHVPPGPSAAAYGRAVLHNVSEGAPALYSRVRRVRSWSLRRARLLSGLQQRQSVGGLGSAAASTAVLPTQGLGGLSISFHHLQVPLLVSYGSPHVTLPPPWAGVPRGISDSPGHFAVSVNVRRPCPLRPCGPVHPSRQAAWGLQGFSHRPPHGTCRSGRLHLLLASRAPLFPLLIRPLWRGRPSALKG